MMCYFVIICKERITDYLQGKELSRGIGGFTLVGKLLLVL
jgi:hypothetical protein